jgi:hypothetical protein
LLLVLGTILFAFAMNRPKEAAHDLSSARNEPAEPLRIRALEVLHLKHFDDKRTRPRRLLGGIRLGRRRTMTSR